MIESTRCATRIKCEKDQMDIRNLALWHNTNRETVHFVGCGSAAVGCLYSAIARLAVLWKREDGESESGRWAFLKAIIKEEDWARVVAA